MPINYLQAIKIFDLKQMHGNSFQRKLTIVKSGGTPARDVRLLYIVSILNPHPQTQSIDFLNLHYVPFISSHYHQPPSSSLHILFLVSWSLLMPPLISDFTITQKPKRRTPVSYGGRSAVPDKSQRSRSMSFSPERVRVRGRSPAFNALAATFENPNTRNLSTPPPVRKIYPKSVSPDSAKLAAAKSTIAALGASFEQPPPAREAIIPHSIKGSLQFINPWQLFHGFIPDIITLYWVN